MTTVSNSFERYCVSVTNSTPTNIISGNVPANTDFVVTGLIVGNSHAANPATVSIQVTTSNGANSFYLIRSNSIPFSESLIAIGWDQKIVLKPDDNIKVTAVSGTVDVHLSVLKITTT